MSTTTATTMDDDTSSDIPSFERADSGGSSCSSASSSSSILSSSECSSLFSADGDGDGVDSERRSSFASSVYVSEEEDDNNNKEDIIDSEASTPTPGLYSPSTSSTTGMSLSRTTSSHSTTTQGSSDDGSSSTSSHESYISTTHMATPTAEIRGLSSLHPIIPTSISISALVELSSPIPSSIDRTIATTSTMQEQRQPHYSTTSTNNSIIISSTSSIVTKNTKQIPATSPEMLRFAARVASRGVVQFSPKRVSSSTPTSITIASSNNSRPSISRSSTGRTLNAEGFPWTARPSSSYSPRSSTGTSSSRPSTSTSGSSSSRYLSSNTTYASSLGGTPSAIFATYEEDISESSEEEEMESLSELFLSNFSGRKNRTNLKNAASASHLSRSTPAPSSNASSSLNSTSIRDTAFLTNSQSGAPSREEQQHLRHLQDATQADFDDTEARMNTISLKDGACNVHDGFLAATDSETASSIPRTSTTHQSSNTTAVSSHSHSPRSAEIRDGLGASHSSDQASSSTSPVVDTASASASATGSRSRCDNGHSWTPLEDRSIPGALESTTIHHQSMSSSSSMRAGTGYLSSSTMLPLPPRSASPKPSASISHSDLQVNLSRQDTVTARDTQANHQDSTTLRERTESLFRYEAHSAAPSSSTPSMAATVALPQAQQYQMTPTAPPVVAVHSSPSKAGDASGIRDPKSISPKVPENTKNLDEVNAQSASPSAKPTMNRYDLERRPQVPERKASLDYGDRLSHYAGGGGGASHGGSASLYGAHLNSLNYHAGAGHNTYSSRPSTTSSSSSAYLSSTGMSRGTWTRPWVKDSDSSSIKSSSGLSSDGSRSSFENSDRELNVMSPAAPPQVPFLSTAPAPPGCKIVVEALQSEGFDIFITLPGFRPENITLALKKSGALHILADKYEDEHGHFERMVELGEPAKDCKVTAVFNGDTLEVHVRKEAKEEQTVKSITRSWSPSSSNPWFGAGSTSSSTSSTSSPSSSYKSNSGGGASSAYEPPVYFGGTDPVAFYSSSPLLAGASYIAK